MLYVKKNRRGRTLDKKDPKRESSMGGLGGRSSERKGGTRSLSWKKNGNLRETKERGEGEQRELFLVWRTGIFY